MFTYIVAIAVLVVIGIVLGAALPKVPAFAWGTLLGLVLSYYFIYDNEYLRYSLMGHSSSVVDSTMTIVSIIGAVIICVVVVIGVAIGKKRRNTEAVKETPDSDAGA